MITITPTLSSTSGYLQDIRDQISNLLRFMIYNPGRTSSLWEKEMISFRTLSAEYQNSRSSLATMVNNRLTRSLNRMFPDYQFDVTVSTDDYDEKVGDDGRYTLTIGILINGLDPDHPENQTGAVISGRITVDKVTNAISLTFDKSVDTAELTTT